MPQPINTGVEQESGSNAQKTFDDLVGEMTAEFHDSCDKAVAKEEESLCTALKAVSQVVQGQASASAGLMGHLLYLLSADNEKEANRRIREQVMAICDDFRQKVHELLDKRTFYSHANLLNSPQLRDCRTRELTASLIQPRVAPDATAAQETVQPSVELVMQDTFPEVIEIPNHDSNDDVYEPSRNPTPQTLGSANRGHAAKKTKRPKGTKAGKAKASRSGASSSGTSLRAKKSKASSNRFKGRVTKRTRPTTTAVSLNGEASQVAAATSPLAVRTTTFAEVFQNGQATKKYYIGEIGGHYYHVSCDIHNESFLDKKDCFKAAIGHMSQHSPSTGRPAKKGNYETMIPQLGVHIVDCTRINAVKNNRIRQLAIAASRAHWLSHQGEARALPIEQVTDALIEKYRVKELVPWRPYAAFLGDNLAPIPAVALPVTGPLVYLQDLHKNTINNLLRRRPDCVVYDKVSQEFRGWAVGYRDGEARVQDRLYPVLGFDNGQDSTNRVVEWVSLAQNAITPYDGHNTGQEMKRQYLHTFIAGAIEVYDNEVRIRQAAEPVQNEMSAASRSPTLTDPNAAVRETQPEASPRPTGFHPTAEGDGVASPDRESSEEYLPTIGEIASSVGPSTPAKATRVQNAKSVHPPTSAGPSPSSARPATPADHGRPNEHVSWITPSRPFSSRGRQPEPVMNMEISPFPI